MTTGPDDERRPPEPTFADLMNAFSFDSGRRSKRKGRRRDQRDHQSSEGGTEAGGSHARYDNPYDNDPYSMGYHDPYGMEYHDPYGMEYHDPYGAYPGQPGDRHDDRSGTWYEEPDPRYPEAGGTAQVRPYAWTRGRTRSGFALEIETLVTTSARGREQLAVLQYEHRQVAELCDQVRSVAEVAALLGVPLGVAKVLVGDMAGLGLVVVHQTVSGNGDVPDLALMERVLSGLRRL
jgi:Protein of unknown function (DUF742)